MSAERSGICLRAGECRLLSATNDIGLEAISWLMVVLRNCSGKTSPGVSLRELAVLCAFNVCEDGARVARHNIDRCGQRASTICLAFTQPYRCRPTRVLNGGIDDLGKIDCVDPFPLCSDKCMEASVYWVRDLSNKFISTVVFQPLYKNSLACFFGKMLQVWVVTNGGCDDEVQFDNRSNQGLYGE